MTNHDSLRKAEAIHHQHTQGLRDLSFYQYEINVMEERLREVISKNTTHDIFETVAGFREELIRLQKMIDQLNHGFTVEEFKLAAQLEGQYQPGEPDTKKAWQLHDSLVALRDDTDNLRDRVNSFLSKVL